MTTAPQRTKHKPSTSALSSKNYRTYLYGNIFSMLGIWIQRLAIGWHAWQLSESAFIVGLTATLQFLPILFLTPLFGVMADRIQSRSGAFVLNAMMMVVAALLGAATLQGAMTIQLLLSLALLHGFVVSAYTPIRLTLIPDLVPPALFPSAVAMISITFNLSRFIGPGLGGVIVAMYGLGWAYIINSLTYLPVLFSLSLIRIDHEKSAAKSTKTYRQQLIDGFNYTREHPQIRQAILLAGVSAFCGRSILELMPAFTALIFQGGSNVLALLMAAAGVGAIFGSSTFLLPILQARTSLLVVTGSVGVVFTLFLFGFVQNIYTGVAAVVLLGFSSCLVAVGSQSLLQVRVENELRGRVMSLWILLNMGGVAVGSIIGGALARKYGAPTTTFIFAAICLLLIVAIVVRKPSAKLTQQED